MALAESPPVSVPHQGQGELVGRDADRTVVWLRGEHDLSTTAEVTVALARAIALDDADLVIDLSGVEFMGAETIGVMATFSTTGFSTTRRPRWPLITMTPAARTAPVRPAAITTDHPLARPEGRAAPTSAAAVAPLRSCAISDGCRQRRSSGWRGIDGPAGSSSSSGHGPDTAADARSGAAACGRGQVGDGVGWRHDTDLRSILRA